MGRFILVSSFPSGTYWTPRKSPVLKSSPPLSGLTCRTDRSPSKSATTASTAPSSGPRWAVFTPSWHWKHQPVMHLHGTMNSSAVSTLPGSLNAAWTAWMRKKASHRCRPKRIVTISWKISWQTSWLPVKVRIEFPLNLHTPHGSVGFGLVCQVV